MSRRRKRSAAYMARRRWRARCARRHPSAFTTMVDPAMVALLTAPTIAAGLYSGRILENVAQCMRVPERYLTGEGLPEVTEAEHAAARAFFDHAVNVTLVAPIVDAMHHTPEWRTRQMRELDDADATFNVSRYRKT